jgi:eukaryotic-like serine/threonine-protein kinase
LSQPPIPLNQAKPGLRFPATIEAVLMRGLSKEPSKRFGDVLTLASEFCNAASAPAEDEKRGFASKLASMFRKKD